MNYISSENIKGYDYSPVKSALLTANDGGLSVKGTALAIVSTVVGGGIVSIPFAFLTGGLMIGLITNIICAALMLLAVRLLLKSKDLLGYE